MTLKEALKNRTKLEAEIRTVESMSFKTKTGTLDSSAFLEGLEARLLNLYEEHFNLNLKIRQYSAPILSEIGNKTKYENLIRFHQKVLNELGGNNEGFQIEKIKSTKKKIETLDGQLFKTKTKMNAFYQTTEIPQ